MEISMKVLGVMNKEINHQQYETDHKKQNKRNDQFHYYGKPHRLMIKGWLQVKDENCSNEKTNDTERKSKLINRNMHTQIVALPNKIEEENNAE